MKAISLYELNNLVKELIDGSFTESYWITAELSEVNVSAKGHCFIELVQKADRNSIPLARARAVIMSYIFPILRQTFEQTTGQAFCVGLKVQLEVEVSFSEVYGYSLIVKDIDPTYTMGSLAQLRKEILEHLQRDGVIEMNKSLELARPLQRIAVISSPTAAGYGDFCAQLDNNPKGYGFIHKLFPSLMQGEATAPSMIGALDTIAQQSERWDAVVIIRGGGAVSDLAGFEDYELAAHCAQFPLPIITGIGHERDITVLDYVANTHLKTPTAAAAFLVNRMDEENALLNDIESAITDYSKALLTRQTDYISAMMSKITLMIKTFSADRNNRLELVYQRILQKTKNIVTSKQTDLQNADARIAYAVQNTIKMSKMQLDAAERTMALYSPQKLLNMGYSITRSNGHVLVNASSLRAGDTLVTTFAHGEACSIVKTTDDAKEMD